MDRASSTSPPHSDKNRSPARRRDGSFLSTTAQPADTASGCVASAAARASSVSASTSTPGRRKTTASARRTSSRASSQLRAAGSPGSMGSATCARPDDWRPVSRSSVARSPALRSTMTSKAEAARCRLSRVWSRPDIPGRARMQIVNATGPEGASLGRVSVARRMSVTAQNGGGEGEPAGSASGVSARASISRAIASGAKEASCSKCSRPREPRSRRRRSGQGSLRQYPLSMRLPTPKRCGGARRALQRVAKNVCLARTRQEKTLYIDRSR